MSLPHRLMSLWRNLAHRDRVDRELQAEIDATLEMLEEEQIDKGMCPDAARRRARLQLGGVESVKAQVRDVRQGAAIASFVQDVRYALRLLRRSPGFTVVAVLTLALGIGASTTMYSIVDGVLLRPLPYPDSDRLMRLSLANAAQAIPDGMVSPPDFDTWQRQAKSFTSMGAYQVVPVTLTGRGDPLEIQVTFARGAFFETLGTPPLLGRTLSEQELRQAVPSAVISERLWRTRFGADPAVLDQPLRIMNRSFTVVGVMPAEFRFPASDADAWAPRSVLNEIEIGPDNRQQRVLETVARLRHGASSEAAGAELTTITARLAAEFPDTNAGWDSTGIVPLRTSMVDDVDTALLVLLAMVGLTLLIGSVNLAHLMLARGSARNTEMAVRCALGATRMRIVRQLLTESVVLALLGGALGVAASVWGVHAILALSADTLPRVEEIRVDARVVAVGLVMSLATAALFGVLPALRAAQAQPNVHLRGGRTTIGRGHHLRNALVVAEVTLAVVLVIGAALMARSFLLLRSVDPGFSPDGVIATTIMINAEGASDVVGHIVQRRRAFIERFSALPGVTAVGAVNSLPLASNGWESFEFTRADGTGMPDGSKLRADRTYVDGDYFRAMGIPVRGEELPRERADVPEGAPMPFLVSETAARRFWPNQDPVGQVVRGAREAVVVGVVGDVRLQGLPQPPAPAVYFPHFIGPRIITTIVARSAGEPAALVGAIRQATREVDPNQPIRSIAPLREVMAASIARDRFFTVVIGLFGTLALVLAMIGVYGVLACAVGQRTAEIGLRMALGARREDVLRMIVGSGMRLVAAGVLAGVAAALLLTRVLRSQLYAVSATDPASFAMAAGGMLLAALAASAIPASRAMRIQPVTALREE